MFLAYCVGQMLLKAVKIKYSFKKANQFFLRGIFFSIFLPSTIGGDLVRTADIVSHTQKTNRLSLRFFWTG